MWRERVAAATGKPSSGLASSEPKDEVDVQNQSHSASTAPHTPPAAKYSQMVASSTPFWSRAVSESILFAPSRPALLIPPLPPSAAAVARLALRALASLPPHDMLADRKRIPVLVLDPCPLRAAAAVRIINTALAHEKGERGTDSAAVSTASYSEEVTIEATFNVALSSWERGGVNNVKIHFMHPSLLASSNAVGPSHPLIASAVVLVMGDSLNTAAVLEVGASQRSESNVKAKTVLYNNYAAVEDGGESALRSLAFIFAHSRVRARKNPRDELRVVVVKDCCWYSGVHSGEYPAGRCVELWSGASCFAHSGVGSDVTDVEMLSPLLWSAAMEPGVAAGTRARTGAGLAEDGGAQLLLLPLEPRGMGVVFPVVPVPPIPRTMNMQQPTVPMSSDTDAEEASSVTETVLALMSFPLPPTPASEIARAAAKDNERSNSRPPPFPVAAVRAAATAGWHLDSSPMAAGQTMALSNDDGDGFGPIPMSKPPQDRSTTSGAPGDTIDLRSSDDEESADVSLRRVAKTTAAMATRALAHMPQLFSTEAGARLCLVPSPSTASAPADRAGWDLWRWAWLTSGSTSTRVGRSRGGIIAFLSSPEAVSAAATSISATARCYSIMSASPQAASSMNCRHDPSVIATIVPVIIPSMLSISDAQAAAVSEAAIAEEADVVASARKRNMNPDALIRVLREARWHRKKTYVYLTCVPSTFSYDHSSSMVSTTGEGLGEGVPQVWAMVNSGRSKAHLGGAPAIATTVAMSCTDSNAGKSASAALISRSETEGAWSGTARVTSSSPTLACELWQRSLAFLATAPHGIITVVVPAAVPWTPPNAGERGMNGGAFAALKASMVAGSEPSKPSTLFARMPAGTAAAALGIEASDLWYMQQLGLLRAARQVPTINNVAAVGLSLASFPGSLVYLMSPVLPPALALGLLLAARAGCALTFAAAACALAAASTSDLSDSDPLSLFSPRRAAAANARSRSPPALPAPATEWVRTRGVAGSFAHETVFFGGDIAALASAVLATPPSYDEDDDSCSGNNVDLSAVYSWAPSASLSPAIAVLASCRLHFLALVLGALPVSIVAQAADTAVSAWGCKKWPWPVSDTAAVVRKRGELRDHCSPQEAAERAAVCWAAVSAAASTGVGAGTGAGAVALRVGNGVREKGSPSEPVYAPLSYKRSGEASPSSSSSSTLFYLDPESSVACACAAIAAGARPGDDATDAPEWARRSGGTPDAVVFATAVPTPSALKPRVGPDLGVRWEEWEVRCVAPVNLEALATLLGAK